MGTPKKYSRKNNICTCECPIYFDGFLPFIDRIMLKYEVEPNKYLSYIKPTKKTWSSAQNWGSYKRIVELPKIFDYFTAEEYKINVSTFTRDNIQMPFVSSITIKNIDKYKNLKLKEDRKKKLLKLSL